MKNGRKRRKKEEGKKGSTRKYSVLVERRKKMGNR